MPPGSGAVSVAAMPPGPASTRARPKSSTLMRPSRVRITFSGLRSRCVMPLACALASADARSRAVATIVSIDGRFALGDLVAQRVPFDELRRDVELSVELLQRVDRADARMRQHRGGARFAAQAIAMQRLARQLRRERLQRDGAAEPAVRGEVHAAHPAAPDLANDGVRAEHRSGLERVLLFEQMRSGFGDGLGEERSGARVVIEQRSHFGAHDGIVRRGLFEPAQHIGRLVLERVLEQISRAASLFGVMMVA